MDDSLNFISPKIRT